jgi:uncharacterized cupredoxin-like copper-binding protein
MVRRVIGAFALAALVLAGCGSSSESSDSPDATAAEKARLAVTIDTSDFAYTLPESIPAGWVDVTITNSGKVDHQIAFVKLDGTTFEEFEQRVYKTNLADLPPETVFAGGPNNVAPGGEVTASVHLEEGTYGVACFIPAEDGKSHAEHGMIGQVAVTKTDQSVETAPVADGGRLDMSEFLFTPSADFNGKGTISMKNDGVQVHEVIIYKINEGKTMKDVTDFLIASQSPTPPTGPPPFTADGGVVGVGPKQVNYLQLDLAPGKYALLCFFPDPTKDNTPHALEGMVKEITIT